MLGKQILLRMDGTAPLLFDPALLKDEEEKEEVEEEADEKEDDEEEAEEKEEEDAELSKLFKGKDPGSSDSRIPSSIDGTGGQTVRDGSTVVSDTASGWSSQGGLGLGIWLSLRL